jgi:hypothetical protein
LYLNLPGCDWSQSGHARGVFLPPIHDFLIPDLTIVFLQEGKKLPTYNRRQYVLRKTKSDFRAYRKEMDGDKVDSLIVFAEDSLDNLMHQVAHHQAIGLEHEPDEISPPPSQTQTKTRVARDPSGPYQ